jgi:hypothetical protein
MPRSDRILEQYLEGISWEAMDQYPDVIKLLIRRRSGVYALYDGEQLYYVGLASNLMGRLKTHLKDRHRGLWDRFSVYLTARTEQSHIRELEALLLRIVSPAGNKVAGRLRAAKNLYPSLHASMSLRDAERRAGLLGGVAAKRLQRKLIRAATRPAKVSQRQKGDAYPAAGIASVRLPLQGTYKGTTYSATLRRDGQIRLDGILYPSPTAAATMAIGRRMNGWWFWKARKGSDWTRLKELRAIR